MFLFLFETFFLSLGGHALPLHLYMILVNATLEREGTVHRDVILKVKRLFQLRKLEALYNFSEYCPICSRNNAAIPINCFMYAIEKIVPVFL